MSLSETLKLIARIYNASGAYEKKLLHFHPHRMLMPLKEKREKSFPRKSVMFNYQNTALKH